MCNILEGKEKLHIFINPDPSNDTVFLATATFQRNVNDSGWDRFSTEILPSSTPALQRGSYYLGMRAIGFLEGYLTCREANDYYMNFYHSVYYQR